MDPVNVTSERRAGGPPILCVFAKPARPGEAKTRLASPSHADTAARLAASFFADTWRSVSALGWARPVVATTDVGAAQWRSLPAGAIWPQGDGDLGDRLERVLRRALRESDVTIAIGGDTPGLPERLLVDARDALRVADAALGPADDGGFYLIALARCPPGLFRDLPWSEPTTCTAMRARLEGRGMTVHMLAPWFDVDRPEDLARLRALIARGEVLAPATAALLADVAQERDRCR